MKRLAIVLASIGSLASLLVLAGGGLALFAIEVSGERGAGALLAAGGLAAAASVAALIFARNGTFGSGAWRAGAILLAMAGAAPPAALAFLAFRFAKNPFASPLPGLEWTALIGGALLALGTVSILAIGHWRSQEGDEQPLVHMQQIRNAQQQLRSAFEEDRRIPNAPAPRQAPQPAAPDEYADDEIRVRRV